MEPLLERLREVIAVHFHPESGTRYWLDRARALGLDPLEDVRTVADLALFGDMTPADLSGSPLADQVPKALHDAQGRLIVGKTGGTTGGGIWTAYRDDEFDDAFVRPFVVAADHVGFPRGERWLYVGPTGPHVMCKAASQLARARGSPDPFSVDFDARWARKLPEGSFACERYTQHVVDQAMCVIEMQDIGILFTTPDIIARLATKMSLRQRARIRGVHYGGMEVTSQELERFQLELLPDAVHLAGYGNTLFGCCLELTSTPGRQLDYYPHGNRLLLEIVNDRGEAVPEGETGALRFTRLDETVLIIRMRERDEAVSVALPDGAPEGYASPGVRNPRTSPAGEAQVSLGLY
ncbi:MAG: hypothetical protein ACE5HE_04445 [Phycisphaerae bacterium]